MFCWSFVFVLLTYTKPKYFFEIKVHLVFKVHLCISYRRMTHVRRPDPTFRLNLSGLKMSHAIFWSWLRRIEHQPLFPHKLHWSYALHFSWEPIVTLKIHNIFVSRSFILHQSFCAYYFFGNFLSFYNKVLSCKPVFIFILIYIHYTAPSKSNQR